MPNVVKRDSLPKLGLFILLYWVKTEVILVELTIVLEGIAVYSFSHYWQYFMLGKARFSELGFCDYPVHSLTGEKKIYEKREAEDHVVMMINNGDLSNMSAAKSTMNFAIAM